MIETRLPLVPVILGVLLFACTGLTPTSTVKGFYGAVEKGDADAALNLLSAQFVEMLGEDKLRAGVQGAALKIREKDGISEIQITKEEVVGEVATVSVILKYGNGTAEAENHKLVKEKGFWKLQPDK